MKKKKDNIADCGEIQTAEKREFERSMIPPISPYLPLLDHLRGWWVEVPKK